MWTDALAHRLRTPRMLLRCFEPGDGRVLRAALERSGSPRMSSTAMENRACELYARFERRLELTYAVFDSEPRDLLGLVSVFLDEGTPLLSGWLTAGRGGRGLAREAVGALTRVAFELGGVDRMELFCPTANPRVARLAECLGYRLTAIGYRLDRLDYPDSPAAAAAVTACDKLGRSLALWDTPRAASA